MWRSLLQSCGPGEHITQYYRDPEFLHEALGVWLGTALKCDGGNAVLTTPENWALIEDALLARGVSPRTHLREGHIIHLDVDEFLEKFLETGAPDPVVFTDMVDAVVETLRVDKDQVGIRFWGEAVEVLRKRDEWQAAEALERMWNTAIEQNGFSLLCSYQVNNLEASTHNPQMVRLTEEHSHLIPETDYRGLNQAVDRALVDLYGAEGACTLWAKLWHEGLFWSRMPAGQAVLTFFGRHRPDQAGALFDRVKQNFMPADSHRLVTV